MMARRTLLAMGLLFGLASAGAAAPSGGLALITNEARQPWLVRDVGGSRLFLVEKAGKIRVYENNDLLSTPFLDLHTLVQSGGEEQGLLGLAFHPEYNINGYFFVSYTNSSGDLVVARYTVSNDPDVADPASALGILTVDLPSSATDYAGGSLEFGPDGLLYIGVGAGDGGLNCDPGCQAQRTDSWLGKLLRIDVDQASGGRQYGIPFGNPFRDPNDGKLDEIWAYGLHDPRWVSFDALTGQLYIADLGRGDREEINAQPTPQATGGQNYGWKLREGTLCQPCSTTDCPVPAVSCDATIAPLAEYAHGSGASGDCRIIGLGTYRGGAVPSLQGYYLFGDACSGRISALSLVGQPTTTDFLQLPGLSSLSVVESGRLYATAGDELYEIVSTQPTPTATPTPDVFATPTPTLPGGATATPTPGAIATPTETPLPGGPEIVGGVVEKDTEVEFSGASIGSLGVQIRDLTSNETLGTGPVNGVGQGRVTLSSPAAQGHRLAAFDLSTQRQGPEVVVTPFVLRGPSLPLLGLAGALIIILALRRRSRAAGLEKHRA